MIILGAVSAGAVAAAGAELPSRKPGLWDITMKFESGGQLTQAMQQCIDAATDKEMNALGQGMTRDACSKQDLKTVGGTMIIDSTCRIGGVTTSSRAEITGSFDRAYSMKLTSRNETPSPDVPAQTVMRLDAKWVGPCAAGQKPGDVIMPGGMKVNVMDMRPPAGQR